jgi:myo-inositol-1(or 4)-monophosphatase
MHSKIYASTEIGAAVRPSLLAIAMTAAQRGGEVLRRYFRSMDPSEVSEKAENDFVSAADRESEEAITSYLRVHTPALGVLAEEGGASGAKGDRWVVDPLDGTANFVRGFPHFGVSVALVAEGAVRVGAIYDPMRDELFSALRGGGAWCNGRRRRVTARDGLAGGFVTTGFPFRVHHLLDTYLRVFHDVFLRVAAIRRPGAAALDLAHTAAGIFDGFFEFCLSPWDIAAGALLVREAGGVVTNLDGEDEIFTHGNVVAAGPGVQRALLAVIQRHCREKDIYP